jgi:hypothetical protein
MLLLHFSSPMQHFKPKSFMLTILVNGKVHPYTGQKMLDKGFLLL